MNEGRIITVLVVNGKKLASELYTHALSRRSRFRVIAQVGEIKEAVRLVQEKGVDVALISAMLENDSQGGLKALRQIRQACPSVKSVMVINRGEETMATAAFRAGAKGVFNSENDGFDLLCRCVEQVKAGQVWANSAQLQKVLDEFSRRAPVQIVSARGEKLLTKREQEIVHLVEGGLTNRQIANDLGLSEHTVRNNLFRIFDKLGVSTRVELALYAINHSELFPVEEPAASKKVARLPVSKRNSVTEMKCSA